MKKTVSFSKHACNVFFHILTSCNLSCTHCYINREQHGDQTLPLDTIAAWLRVFADKSNAANVIFLGGEPTLHPGLPKAIQTARQLGYASVTVDTNGYLFHDILKKISPQELDYFSFSLDGATENTNDALRGTGSYRTCLAGVRAAVQRGFSTSMIYTVSSANIHELAMMPEIIENLGVNRFFIQVIGIRGKSAAPSDRSPQVSPDAWLSVVPPAAAAIADLGITVTYPKVFLEPHETFECAGVVADNFFVFPNGRVYRCPLCEDFPIHGYAIDDGRLTATPRINETDLFGLTIAEGCVLNKIIQPGNIRYRADGTPQFKIACCMLKEEIG